MISSFTRLVDKTDGCDKILRVICYSGKLIAVFLLKGGSRSREYARRLAPILASLTESRVVLRLFGIPQTIDWLLNLNPKEDDYHYKLLQIISLLIYYPMEHAYYAAIKGAIVLSPEKANALSQWSCRAWFCYLLVDAWTVVKECRKENEKQAMANEARVAIAIDNKIKRQLELEQRRNKLIVKMIGIFSDIPLALTWSFSRGFLSDFWIGLFGTMSSISGITLKMTSTT